MTNQRRRRHPYRRRKSFFQDAISSSEHDVKNRTPVLQKGVKNRNHEDKSHATRHLLQAILVEFVGTFMLTLTVGLAVNQSSTSGQNSAPAAIGVMLAVLVYMGAYISGAHYNPAVTVALYLRGKLSLKTLVAYVSFQILGGLAGAGIAKAILKGSDISMAAFAPNDTVYPDGTIFAMETMWSFLLVFSVLQCASTKIYAGNSFFGIVIGLSVTVGAYNTGSISGAALNPAVGLGMCAFSNSMEHVWLYIVGPVLGSLFAVFFFSVTAEDIEFVDMERPVLVPQFRDSMRKLPHHAKSLVIEFIGTAFLCLAVAMNPIAVASTGVHPGFPIGITLMIVIYAGGHISGAHYNPAVTLAIFLRGDVSPGKAPIVIGYIVAQLFGGWIGALIGHEACADAGVVSGYPRLGDKVGTGSAFFVEYFVTFVLCGVVLNVATTKSLKNNSYFGGAIGGTVIAGAIAVGGYSGGAFNPAVGTTTTTVNSGSDYYDEKIWLYWLAPLCAGASSALFFRLTAPSSEWIKDEDDGHPSTASSTVVDSATVVPVSKSSQSTAETTHEDASKV